MSNYIGARYVPKFIDDPYDPTQAYEALCVVDNGFGTSYISGIPVPPGIPLTNTNYWHIYGASSGAVINLQNQIDNLYQGYIKYFDTFDDLRSNINNVPVGAFVITNGFNSKNDNGGGKYFIVNVPTANAFNIQIGSVYATLVCDYAKINVASCGLYEGSNITEAEAIINNSIVDAAIDLIYNNFPVTVLSAGYYKGGGAIYFPAGNYIFKSGLSNANGKINLEIFGEGQHTRLGVYDSNDDFSFITNHLSGFNTIMHMHIHDLTFTSFDTAIDLKNTVESIIEKCFFLGGDSQIKIDRCVDLTIRDNIFFDGAKAIDFISTDGNSTSFYIQRNWFAHQTNTALNFDTYSYSTGFRTFFIEDNIIEYVPYGIYARTNQSYSHMMIDNNHFEQCSTYAIHSSCVSFKLHGNDIDTNIFISSPADGLYDLDDFENAIAGAFTQSGLKLIWKKATSYLIDTINQIYRILSNSSNFHNFPYDNSNPNYYHVKYSSSAGYWDGYITYTPGTGGVVDGTPTTANISNPAMNAYGTIAFTDNTGSNKQLTIERLG